MTLFVRPATEHEACAVLSNENATMAEKTYAVKLLTAAGVTNRELREMLGADAWYTISHMRTVGSRLDDSLYDLWHKNHHRLTIAHVRTIARWKRSEQEEIMRKALAGGWSQRRLEREVMGKEPELTGDLKALSETASESIGFDTSISYSGGSGTITVKYYSLDDCEHLLERLGYKPQDF